MVLFGPEGAKRLMASEISAAAAALSYKKLKEQPKVSISKPA
jgi:hypothetical protein